MALRQSAMLILGAAVWPCTPALAEPTPAPPAPLPEELVLAGDNIITLTLNGVPLRFVVSADTFGPPVINGTVGTRLLLVPETRRGWRFGPVVIDGSSAIQVIDFGDGVPVATTISWTERTVTREADGVIGVHDLPHARVTFILAPPGVGERILRFPMTRLGGDLDTRLGTRIVLGKRKLMMVFAPQRAENLVTAPTANFIATHQEGGFEPNSDDTALMNFGIERPTRTMRLAEPIMLGDLAIERFAVRIEDYGEPNHVGEIAEGDPRFDKNRILVSRRKGRGRPDLLTRIGRDQIAHCSRLTYDFEANEIRLSCAPVAE